MGVDAGDDHFHGDGGQEDPENLRADGDGDLVQETGGRGSEGHRQPEHQHDREDGRAERGEIAGRREPAAEHNGRDEDTWTGQERDGEGVDRDVLIGGRGLLFDRLLGRLVLLAFAL